MLLLCNRTAASPVLPSVTLALLRLFPIKTLTFDVTVSSTMAAMVAGPFPALTSAGGVIALLDEPAGEFIHAACASSHRLSTADLQTRALERLNDMVHEFWPEVMWLVLLAQTCPVYIGKKLFTPPFCRFLAPSVRSSSCSRTKVSRVKNWQPWWHLRSDRGFLGYTPARDFACCSPGVLPSRGV